VTNPPQITPPLECLPVPRGDADPAPPGAPAALEPASLPAEQGHALLAIDPQADPYRVDVPGICVGLGVQYVAKVQVCVSPAGKVADVKVVEPSIPLIDEQLPIVLGRWIFHPLVVDGEPMSFCYQLNYRVM